MQNTPITSEEAKIANEESIYLYGYLRNKYCNDSIRDLDIVMNALCFSLARLILNYTGKGDRKTLAQIVWKIINDAIENGEERGL